MGRVKTPKEGKDTKMSNVKRSMEEGTTPTPAWIDGAKTTADAAPNLPASAEKPSYPQHLGLDLASLRLSQDFDRQVGVKRLITTVPVRKPNRQEFVRVHPEWKFQAQVIELKEERETYLVDRPLWDALATELTPKMLLGTINRQHVLFIWPIRLPGSDGKLDEWNLSAVEAAVRAEDHWVRVAANMSLGAYEISEAQGPLADPRWPDITFEAALGIAFKGKVIKTLDHPVVRRLLGQA